MHTGEKAAGASSFARFPNICSAYFVLVMSYCGKPNKILSRIIWAYCRIFFLNMNHPFNLLLGVFYDLEESPQYS